MVRTSFHSKMTGFDADISEESHDKMCRRNCMTNIAAGEPNRSEHDV